MNEPKPTGRLRLAKDWAPDGDTIVRVLQQEMHDADLETTWWQTVPCVDEWA